MTVILILLILAGLGAFAYLFRDRIRKEPDPQQTAQSPGIPGVPAAPTGTPAPSLTELLEKEKEELEKQQGQPTPAQPTPGQPLPLPGSTVPTEEQQAAQQPAPTGTPSGEATAPAVEKPELYYYRSLLSDSEKAIYDQICEGIAERSDMFRIDGEIENARFEIISHYVFCDHPELFWFKGPCYSTVYTEQKYRMSEYEYTSSGEEVAARKDELEAEVSAFLATVDESWSDYDKIKAVYDYLCFNTVYLHSPDDQNIYSCLVNHETVCEGYARSAQYLLQRLGIPCILVEGHGEDIPEDEEFVPSDDNTHAWNTVWCGDNWYNMDVTWGDAGSHSNGEIQNAPDEIEANFAYLLCDDDMFYGRQKRLPEEKFFTGVLPACPDPSLRYYPSKGLYFENTEDAWNAVQAGMDRGEKYFRCQFANGDLMNAFAEEFSNGRYTQMALDTFDYPAGARIGAHISRSDAACTVDMWLDE